MATVAEVIAQQRSHIVAAWLDRARGAASARGLALPQLTNLVPAYVETLGRWKAGEQLPTAEQQSLLESHFSHRLRQGFELSEVVVEFSMLATVIGEAIDAVAAAERPTARDITALFQELHAATSTVTHIYSEHLLEDEQLEKRYARLIQDVVTEAIHAGNGGLPMRDRLRDILALVREAVAADVAVLLLCDPESERLISTASSGRGDDSVERYVARVTAGSFVGKVATEPTGVLVLDTAATPLQLDESLRATGIRSLLGVRLADAQSLLGVLFVGTRAQRTFTASDVRRLESLGDRVALHLDNAQLSTRLREKLTQIQVFVDVVAHDLRGPLATAMTAAHLLREQARGPSGAVAAKLEQSLRRAERMVNDLLDAHRIAAGERLPLRVVEAHADRVVAEAIDELTARDARRVVHRDASGALGGPFDAALVQRAVWNLLVNALKYGDPTAPVTVTARGDDRGFVVEVHNEGAPIPAGEQEGLWKPFTRAPTAAKRASGWGLGLALVAGCAAAHGGTIGLHSEAGAGTTFRLAIPWQRAADHVGASAAP